MLRLPERVMRWGLAALAERLAALLGAGEGRHTPPENPVPSIDLGEGPPVVLAGQGGAGQGDEDECGLEPAAGGDVVEVGVSKDKLRAKNAGGEAREGMLPAERGWPGAQMARVAGALHGQQLGGEAVVLTIERGQCHGGGSCVCNIGADPRRDGDAELVTTITSSRKAVGDMAVGNVLGRTSRTSRSSWAPRRRSRRWRSIG